MNPEGRDRSHHAGDGDEIAVLAPASAAGSHDEVILRTARTAAREIRLECRARYLRFGLWVAGVAAVLVLALGAHCARVALSSAADPTVIR